MYVPNPTSTDRRQKKRHSHGGGNTRGERVHGEAGGAGGAVRGDGGVHGEGVGDAAGEGRADRGGAEPAVGGVQERDRGAAGVVADHLVDRAEGGVEGKRGAREHHQELPVQDRDGALQHLRRHSQDARRPPHPFCFLR